MVLGELQSKLGFPAQTQVFIILSVITLKEEPALIPKWSPVLPIDFEDLKVGDKFISPGRTITVTDSLNFSGLVGSYPEMFSNEEYIKNETILGIRVAQGPLIYVISLALEYRIGWFQGKLLAQLEIDELRNLKFVPIGDTIYVEVEIVAKRESKSNPERGIVTTLTEVKNQRGETAITYKRTLLYRRGPS